VGTLARVAMAMVATSANGRRIRMNNCSFRGHFVLVCSLLHIAGGIPLHTGAGRGLQ
jgi:hypothetical protein